MNPAAYAAAHEACACAEPADRGWLEVAGPDARDFLQRVLTSDLRALRAGGGQWSAMLDGKGHWIADLLLYALDDDGRFGLDLPAQRLDPVAARLELLHFSERLRVEAPRPQPARLLLLGPQADRAAATLGLPPLGGDDAFATAATATLRLLRRADRGAPAIEVLGAGEELRALAARLAEAGIPRAGADALETLRVEAFVPRWGADFDESSTLPDSNEWRRASLTKGCYAGQEVVAKINTYGEAPRQLCRLRGSADAGVSLAGAELGDGSGRVLGTVTSWTWSPRGGRGVGLGLLRRRAAFTGARLTARAQGAETGVEVELPPKMLG